MPNINLKTFPNKKPEISKMSLPLKFLYNLVIIKIIKKAIIETYNLDLNYDDDVIEEVEIQIKYEGYIKKVEREVEKMLKNSEKQIPEDIDYDKVPNLASEARQKLKEVIPLNIAQAIRISGVNPSDISILLVYLRKQYNE